MGEGSATNRPEARASTGIALPRLAFLDHIRYLMVLLVVAHHSVAAYAVVAPHWVVHDTTFFAADIVRELFDVFMMPMLFFVSGYLALPSAEKKGVRAFLLDKVKRLLMPWALAALVFVPLLMYGKADGSVKPFWRYWLWYMGSFETGLRFTQSPRGPTTQVVYWFVSLLFAFFLLFALAYALARRWRGGAARRSAPGDSRQAILVTLLCFGLLTSAAYYLSLRLMPDTSWFTLSAFLEFQVTRVVLYAACFALGVYAQMRGWFSEGKPLGSLAVWGASSAALTVAFLVIGQPVFTDPAGAMHLSAGFLLAFAIIRSFLVLSLLVVLVSFGIRHWNRSSTLDRQLSETSYNIYLTHYWVVVLAQGALLDWTTGPALAKAAIVFIVAVLLSFALSKWLIGRWPRAFAIGILALFVFCLAVRP